MTGWIVGGLAFALLAVVIALEHRHGVVLGHEIDLLRQRADKTDDRTAQLRTDIDATRDWTWDHHDAHGWGEEPEPAEPVHPATQAIPVVSAVPVPPQNAIGTLGGTWDTRQGVSEPPGNAGEPPRAIPAPTPSAPLQAPQAHAQGHEETPEPPPGPQNGAQGDYGASAQDRRPTPGPRHGSDERMTRSERRKIREGTTPE